MVSNISKWTTIVVKHLTVLDVLRACRASPTKSRRAYRHVINQAPGFHHSNGGTIKKSSILIGFSWIFHYKPIFYVNVMAFLGTINSARLDWNAAVLFSKLVEKGLAN